MVLVNVSENKKVFKIISTGQMTNLQEKRLARIK